MVHGNNVTSLMFLRVMSIWSILTKDTFLEKGPKEGFQSLHIKKSRNKLRRKLFDVCINGSRYFLLRTKANISCDLFAYLQKMFYFCTRKRQKTFASFLYIEFEHVSCTIILFNLKKQRK